MDTVQANLLLFWVVPSLLSTIVQLFYFRAPISRISANMIITTNRA